MVSFKAFRGPLFPKPVSWLGLFFAIFYIKPDLVFPRSYDSVPKSQWDFNSNLLQIVQPITIKFNLVFLKGRNFRRTGFPSDCHTKERSLEVLGFCRLPSNEKKLDRGIVKLD